MATFEHLLFSPKLPFETHFCAGKLWDKEHLFAAAQMTAFGGVDYVQSFKGSNAQLTRHNPKRMKDWF